MTPVRLLPLAAAMAAGAVLLTACGSSTSGGSTASSAPTAAAAAPSVPSGGRGFAPAASGVIAAISGKTLQVQSSTQQNAVTYSAGTRFTEQQKTSLAAIKVGMCITATSATSTSTSAPSPTGSASRPTHITADRVEVLGTGSGCGFGARSRGGSGIPSRPAGSFPNGRPSGMPSASAGFRRGFADRVAGKVTKVSGTTITVSGIDGPGTTGSASRTVTVTASTTYTDTATTTAKALKVGLCAVVQGSTNSTGAVAARSIALSPKTGGSCETGFSFGGFGPGRSGAGG